jgi:amino acid transporter
MQRDAGLVRGIRKWDLVAFFINSVIGGGIFGLPSQAFALTGVYSIVAYLVCALLAALIVACFAELGSRYSATGGPYLFAREAFGGLVGFEVGWLLWLARLTACAALCNLFLDYLTYLWPVARSEPWRSLLVTAIVATITVVNVAGVRVSALFGDLFTIGKLAALLVFVVVGAFFISPDNYAVEAPPPDYRSFSTAALLLMFAFSGFEIPMITAGETRDPRREVPVALFVALTVVLLFYVSIQIVCIGTLPGLATSQRPLADASRLFLGAGGAIFITVGALISAIGTLNASMLAAPRLLFAMAEEGQLPRALAAVHPRLRTPHLAVLFTSGIVLALTLSGSFISAVTMSAITRLIVYAASCVAVPVLRRRSRVPAATFVVRGGVFIPALALALCVWLLSNSGAAEARNVAIAALAGLVLHLVFRRRG